MAYFVVGFAAGAEQLKQLRVVKAKGQQLAVDIVNVDHCIGLLLTGVAT